MILAGGASWVVREDETVVQASQPCRVFGAVLSWLGISYGTSYNGRILGLLKKHAAIARRSQQNSMFQGMTGKTQGDLHGQLRDLLMFFHAFGLPAKTGTSFVFNGDFVDRGAHQLEALPFGMFGCAERLE